MVVVRKFRTYEQAQCFLEGLRYVNDSEVETSDEHLEIVDSRDGETYWRLVFWDHNRADEEETDEAWGCPCIAPDR